MPDFATKTSTVEKPSWWTSDEWETPPEFVTQLEAEFGAFTLDPCARAETAKAPHYYTKDDDGLLQPWNGHVFVNPPYSHPKPWIEKALAESGHGTVSLLLLPAATDVGWFHDLVLPSMNVRFLRGRLRFLGWQGTPIGSPTAGNILARMPKIADGRFHL